MIWNLNPSELELRMIRHTRPADGGPCWFLGDLGFDDGEHVGAVEGELVGFVGGDPDGALVFGGEFELGFIPLDVGLVEDGEFFAVAGAPARETAEAADGGLEAGFFGDFTQQAGGGFVGGFEFAAGESPGVGGGFVVFLGELKDEEVICAIGEEGVEANVVEVAGVVLQLAFVGVC